MPDVQVSADAPRWLEASGVNMQAALNVNAAYGLSCCRGTCARGGTRLVCLELMKELSKISE